MIFTNIVVREIRCVDMADGLGINAYELRTIRDEF